jgi:HAD superfamily hydrolase (TIGR01459 family)
MTRPAIPIRSSISSVAPHSKAWLVDIWGVLHNGARAFPPACAACQTFRAQGGIVVLISNAPRPFLAVVPHLTSLGVPADAYDTGITSGDVTRGLLEAWRGRRVLHIGPERDLGLFTDRDVQLVTAETAEVVVCSGLCDDTKETPADYAPLFADLLARGLPMICANPDIKVERGGELVWCAGALAADYAAKGGDVTYAGKPHLPVYEQAFAAIDKLAGRPIAKNSILGIGDGLETDLRGAHAAGLACVFIASAVHMPGGLNANALHDLFAARPFAPIAALPALA